MTPRAGSTSSDPTAFPCNYDDAIRELASLGVVFESADITAQHSILTATRDKTPYAIKLLAKYDHETLRRIMIAIRNATEHTRIIWTETLGSISSKDITKRGKDIALEELTRIMPQYERLLAVNPIDTALLGIGQKNFRRFMNLQRATHIEQHTGIAPGSHNYRLVQANLIHISIKQPQEYGIQDIQSYLQTNYDDITFIAGHIDETLSLLPELYPRKECSADAIKTMLEVKPVLAEGAL